MRTKCSILFLCYLKVHTLKRLPRWALPLNTVCLRDIGATFDTCAGSKCQVSTVTPCREGEDGRRAMSNSSLDVGYGAGSAAEDQIADIPRKCETVGCLWLWNKLWRIDLQIGLDHRRAMWSIEIFNLSLIKSLHSWRFGMMCSTLA